MKNLTIFEGCDCTGKTTAARAYAEATGALYFPLGPLKGFETISHVYINAMMPAIRRERDVVMDRSWISEPIYGTVFRNGADRIGQLGADALDGLATSMAKSVLVFCDPGWEAVEKVFKSRVDVEMLDNLAQLENVYQGYRVWLNDSEFYSELPVVEYNYFNDSPKDLALTIEGARPQ